METPKLPFHKAVAEKLVAQLMAGTAPWQKPWRAGDPGAFLPINPTTGKRYKGINAIQLMSEGFADQRWMTYKQAEGVGAQVRKGEKGTTIQYWKFSEEHDVRDAAENPLRDEKGNVHSRLVPLERPRVFFATVFNAQQVDGLQPVEPRAQQTWSAQDRAEIILRESNAVIHHGEINRAFYQPATDSIHLPDKAQFDTADRYYATALHELGHWTGHPMRLGRDLTHPFGSEGYAREELRAEIASMILGDELGIGHDPEQHVAYVGSWIKALQDDPLEIFRAAADAEKIHDYVLGLSLEFELSRAPHQDAGITTSAATEASEHQHQLSNGDIDMKIREGGVPVNEDEGESSRIEAELNARYQDATDGNNALTSWKKLKAIAKEWNLVATIGAGGFGEDRAAYLVVYKVPETGARLGIFTALHENGTTETLTTAEFQETITGPHSLYYREVAEHLRVEGVNSGVKPGLGHSKTLIDVPFTEKDQAKAIGAKWDRHAQSWYIPPDVDMEPFAKWRRADSVPGAHAGTSQSGGDKPTRAGAEAGPTYLAVPYADRAMARVAGAFWDRKAKSWYAGSNANWDLLAKWKPENVGVEQGPAMPPREEFTQALKSFGCIVSGDHPIMDGQKHRISVEGEKFSEHSGSGFYVGHLDGHPAGYIKNNKTGVEGRWKSKGYSLSQEQKVEMNAIAAQKLAQRELALARKQELAAERVALQMADLVAATRPTPYMIAKGIVAYGGALTDGEGLTTYVPATDINGKQWTMQYIQEGGAKRFAKDSRKEGCFHVVGGMDKLVTAPVLVIGEGYATAVSLSQALGFPAVAAFDSGNLLPVAQAIHAKFPDKPVVIAADDDRHLEITQGMNPGRRKAEEAARAVGGKVLMPIFAPGENSYSATLDPVTREQYREHQRTGTGLNGEQLAALARMKQYTDFNDLANKSALGTEGVRRQVAAMTKSINKRQSVKLNAHPDVEDTAKPRPRRAKKLT